MLFKQTKKEMKHMESRHIKKDGEGYNQGMQMATYTSLFKKGITLWQHIAFMRRKRYRECTYVFLAVADKLSSAIVLSKLPHFTAVEKFMLSSFYAAGDSSKLTT